MSGKTLFIDYSKCIGCETCEAVCRYLHGLPRINMTRTRDGRFHPLYCKHCDNPRCLNSCPRGALIKAADGTVMLQELVCTGCETKNCILACQYGGIFIHQRTSAAVKCDMCASRRAMGMLPACVEMCPCEAVLFVDRDEIPSLNTKAAEKAAAQILNHLSLPRKSDR